MPIAYDASTALIVVDMQNDFADPGGSLYVSGGDGLLHPLNDEIGRAVAAGAFVSYTQDWHPPSTPHFQTQGGVWPVHCVGGTWGADLVPQLDVVGPVVKKGAGGEDGYSGFSVRDPVNGKSTPTELHTLLVERRIQRAVIAGLATDYCVRETAVDAAHLGFSVLVPKSLVRAVELRRGDASRAFQSMRRAGVKVE